MRLLPGRSAHTSSYVGSATGPPEYPHITSTTPSTGWMIWWESAAKLEKIVELTVTRGAMQKPVTEVWQMYDTDGTTVLETVTDTVSYSGPFEASRARAIA